MHLTEFQLLSLHLALAEALAGEGNVVVAETMSLAGRLTLVVARVLDERPLEEEE